MSQMPFDGVFTTDTSCLVKGGIAVEVRMDPGKLIQCNQCALSAPTGQSVRNRSSGLFEGSSGTFAR